MDLKRGIDKAVEAIVDLAKQAKVGSDSEKSNKLLQFLLTMTK
jgi:hypothetical protein